MMNGRDSNLNAVSASGDAIKMSKCGDIIYTLPDTIGEGGEVKLINETHTSQHLPVPLFPVDKLYQTGEWDLLLRDTKRGGQRL